VEGVERANYGSFEVTASRFKDVTGAYAASLDPSAKGAIRVGNYLVSCTGRCPNNLAALAATSLALAQRIASEAGQGTLREAVTRSSGGYVAIYAVGAAAVLVLIGDEGLDIGRLHRESRATVDSIEALLVLGPHSVLPGKARDGRAAGVLRNSWIAPRGPGDGGRARAAHWGHCTTDHTKVAVPDTPSVSVAVTVTV